MSRGKLAGQVAHAALGCADQYFSEISMELMLGEDRDRYGMYKEWNKTGGKKIILDGGTEEDVNNLLKLLPNDPDIIGYRVYDHGLTELPPNTLTCVAIGPYKKSVLQPYFKELKLLK